MVGSNSECRLACSSEMEICALNSLLRLTAENLVASESLAPIAGRLGCRSRHLVECGGPDTDSRPDLRVQSVLFRDPGRIIIGKPCDPRCILPDQNFKWQVNPGRLGQFHQRSAASCIAKDQ